MQPWRRKKKLYSSTFGSGKEKGGKRRRARYFLKSKSWIYIYIDTRAKVRDVTRRFKRKAGPWSTKKIFGFRGIMLGKAKQQNKRG
jgi:hypothetical protein